jgi:hypothetical protein
MSDSNISTALLMDFLDTPEKRERRMIHLPMGRFGEAVELAKGALFRTFTSQLQFVQLMFRFFS